MQWRDYWTICINLLWLQRAESTSPAVAQSDSPVCHPLSGSYTLLLLLPFSFSFSHSFFYFFSFYFTINRHPPRAWMFIYAFHLMLIACFAPLSSLALPLFVAPHPSVNSQFLIVLSLMAIPPLHCCSFYLRPLTGRPPVGFITNGNYYWYKWCVTVWVCVCVSWSAHSWNNKQKLVPPPGRQFERGRGQKDLQMAERRKGTRRLRHCRNVPKVCWCLDKPLSHVSSNHPPRKHTPTTHTPTTHTHTRTLDAVASVTCVSQVY